MPNELRKEAANNDNNNLIERIQPRIGMISIFAFNNNNNQFVGELSILYQIAGEVDDYQTLLQSIIDIVLK